MCPADDIQVAHSSIGKKVVKLTIYDEHSDAYDTIVESSRTTHFLVGINHDCRAMLHTSNLESKEGPMDAVRKEELTHGSRDPLYQRIYEQHDWYGDAEQGRCPGVRLLPLYQSWLEGSVVDLGCGRGHTVQAIRELDFRCDGIDQVKIHPRCGLETSRPPCRGR